MVILLSYLNDRLLKELQICPFIPWLFFSRYKCTSLCQFGRWLVKIKFRPFYFYFLHYLVCDLSLIRFFPFFFFSFYITWFVIGAQFDFFSLFSFYITGLSDRSVDLWNVGTMDTATNQAKEAAADTEVSFIDSQNVTYRRKM